MKLEPRGYLILVTSVLAAFGVMFAILFIDKISFRCSDAWVCWRVGAPPTSEVWYVSLGISALFSLAVGVPVAAKTIATRLENQASDE